MVLALTYAGMGRSGDARRILRRMEERATNGYYPPAFIAGVYASLGDIESAVTLVQAAVERPVGRMGRQHTRSG